MRTLFLTLLLATGGVAMAQQTEAQADRAEPVEFSPETERAFDRSGRFVTRSKAADGTEIDHHNGSLQMVTVARIGADGQVETLCTSDAEEARRFMQGAATPADDRSASGLELRK